MRKIVSILRYLSLVACFALTACVSAPPKKQDNLCDIFKEKQSWYKAAKKSQKKWRVPMAINMAFMKQESGFRAKAKPPRKKFLWVFPGPRISSAYGYSQAKRSTWKWYKKSTRRWRADRDNFSDAIDFIGWYNDMTARKSGVGRNNATHLYYAYHEGHGGYSRKTWAKKSWLQKVAKKVQNNAARYQQQLNGCEKQLGKKRFLFF